MNKTMLCKPPHAPECWTAKIVSKVPYYTKNCPPWFFGFGGAAICIYRWHAYWSQSDSDVPVWSPKYMQSDPGLPWVPDPGQWVPGQPWWGEYSNRTVTGGWALNTAEFQYLGSVQRSIGSCLPIPDDSDQSGTLNIVAPQVEMFWGIFRDFNRCDLEPRIPYVVPMFHHHMTIPYYADCNF